ncbi:MAG: dihydroorotate dehydrogenase electron transfer subunit [Methanomicrobiales archaeon]|nr:dihydroorotate dehydrogenase electron transfer subunit [Methanomicrobiales archaeon]NYT21054.1 dihydroorotate dehydrogenase electron transfer subunit [Methanomicrobiales archaeon]
MSDGCTRACAITEIVDETSTVRTLYFAEPFDFRAGQFVMVWVPGVDEVPMALSSARSITVQNVGEATAALCGMEEGDLLGIRGPFGNGFPDDGTILAIAGGVGAAPLRPLVMGGRVDTLLLGARSAGELLFSRDFSGAARVRTATDDGSAGHHGFVTDLLAGEDPASFERICVCGPERMMHAVLCALDQQGIAGRGYFSLHRYMKCGIGLCGSCCIDPDGLRVCRDGPVFTGDLLLRSEFGRYCRDASGRKRPV